MRVGGLIRIGEIGVSGDECDEAESGSGKSGYREREAASAGDADGGEQREEGEAGDTAEEKISRQSPVREEELQRVVVSDQQGIAGLGRFAVSQNDGKGRQTISEGRRNFEDEQTAMIVQWL